jgi:type IV pilus assembly protein PilM
MFGLLNRKIYPVGVDIGEDDLKIAQLKESKNSLILISGGAETCPVNIEHQSSDWQKWVIDTMKNLFDKSEFIGREVVAVVPASDVFIDVIKIQKTEGKKFDDMVLARAKQKLPIELDQAMLKYIPSEEDNYIIIATERQNINKHLAIYENAGLNIKSIGVWPLALINSYTRFFGRRKTDLQAVVMLVDICRKRTNVVFCRHKNLLFAKSIPIGVKNLDNNQMNSRLVMELSSVKQNFASVYKKASLDRLVFISGNAVERDVYTNIARQLQLPAQIGDCLSAVQVKSSGLEIERRNCQFSWAASFGLSISVD